MTATLHTLSSGRTVYFEIEHGIVLEQNKRSETHISQGMSMPGANNTVIPGAIYSQTARKTDFWIKKDDGIEEACRAHRHIDLRAGQEVSVAGIFFNGSKEGWSYAVYNHAAGGAISKLTDKALADGMEDEEIFEFLRATCSGGSFAGAEALVKTNHAKRAASAARFRNACIAVVVLGAGIYGAKYLMNGYNERVAEREWAARLEESKKAMIREQSVVTDQLSKMAKHGLRPAMVGHYVCAVNATAHDGFNLSVEGGVFYMAAPRGFDKYPITLVKDDIFTWNPSKQDAKFKITDGGIDNLGAVAGDCARYEKTSGSQGAASAAAPVRSALQATLPATVSPIPAAAPPAPVVSMDDETVSKSLPGTYACQTAPSDIRRIAYVDGRLVWRGSSGDWKLKYSGGVLSIARNNVDYEPVAKFDSQKRAIFPLDPSDFGGCRAFFYR